ncbi:MAG: aldo/keto reductase [Gammaproteobacteria bacterium]|nr:aldo/keto reductase [Gammaproteobacteria bacterium]MDD9897200.1 aldo/keto reductase [Gammaproteobacteria bacterium]MDD9958683.1 aldo/keto reductase [Gammaproteobacteria bacterium]
MSLPQRELGQTGLSVSCLGLGTVKFGRNEEVKYPSSFAIPSDEEVVALLDQAKSLGINLLDTAPAYGSSEQRLGRLLTDREDWRICTKVGEEFISGKSSHDFSRDHVKRSIERSLHNLNTDYLDLVLIHSDGNDLAIIETMECIEALVQFQDAGVIGAIGMSTKSVEGGLRAVDLLDVVMVTYNPGYIDDEAVIDHALANNKGVLIKKALNSGHDCKEGENGLEKNFDFILNREGVNSIIIGTINPMHLKDNVRLAKKVLGA